MQFRGRATNANKHKNPRVVEQMRMPRSMCTYVVVAVPLLLVLSSAIYYGEIVARGTSLLSALVPGSVSSTPEHNRVGEMQHSEDEWRQILGSHAYRIMRQGGTERPRSSSLNDEKRQGTFVCAACAAPLFNSSTKFDSGTGWPSFYKALPGAVQEVPETSFISLQRTEVRCHRCQGHLGHVFDDGPAPTGLRYCMNGAALAFKPDAP